MKSRKEISTYTFVEAISLGNVHYSNKDERFVLDGLQLLGALEDLKQCEIRIMSLIRNESIRASLKNTDIFREFDNSDYFKIKINDIVSTICMHSSRINYSEEDLKDFTLATKKNIAISEIDIPKTILISETVPDFKFRLTNLGFENITQEDKIRITLFNTSLDEKSELIFDTPIVINSLGGNEFITVSDLECPTRQYEYTLKIEIISSGKVVGSAMKPKINIVDRSRFYALQEI